MLDVVDSTSPSKPPDKSARAHGMVRLAVVVIALLLLGRPVGLLISDAKERFPINTRSGKGNFFLMPNGVFQVTRNDASVLTTEAWQRDSFSDPLEATQSGPLLVIDGNLHPAFERDSTSRLVRNGVGVVRASGMVVMGISLTRVNLYEFATMLRDVGCHDALYLDGNVSSVFAPGMGRRDPGLSLGPVLLVSDASG